METASVLLQLPLNNQLQKHQAGPCKLPFRTLSRSIKPPHASDFIWNPDKFSSRKFQFDPRALTYRSTWKHHKTTYPLCTSAAVPPSVAVAFSGALSAAILQAIRVFEQNFSFLHMKSQLNPSTMLCSSGALFFAAMSGSGRVAVVNTPLTVVASGMAKWLELYSGVLMVRVLLSWFPNIPWERQPLSAIRDMCDPYLNLFRNIMPPVFNALDLSPLLAFLVLGFLTSVLNNSMGSV